MLGPILILPPPDCGPSRSAAVWPV